MGFVRGNKPQGVALLLAVIVMVAAAIGFHAQPRWFTETAVPVAGFAAEGLNGLRCGDGLIETKLRPGDSVVTAAGSSFTFNKTADGSVSIQVVMSEKETFQGMIFVPRWQRIGAQPSVAWVDRDPAASSFSTKRKAAEFAMFFQEGIDSHDWSSSTLDVAQVSALEVCTSGAANT